MCCRRLLLLLFALNVLLWSRGAHSEPEQVYRGPVIDMHLHAHPAAANGPPPVAICIGDAANLSYDPKTPWPEFFTELSKHPPCDDPIWGPETDEGVRDETIAAMRRLNVRGVLSGSQARTRNWMDAAPGLFIRGLGLNIKRDELSAAQLGEAFLAGDFEVLAEVTNQYAGIFADDPAFAPYWEIAAKHDIPVGIHVGVGPPGSPLLFPDYRIQDPLHIESVLVKYPTLRVYLMHAGYPFLAQVKALLYAFPQLHVGTGILQASVPRREYYDYLEALVKAGYEDRILFGSDQMNWPGLIEEGIRAINEAPFLSLEQKKAILHDNATRFLRLQGG